MNKSEALWEQGVMSADGGSTLHVVLSAVTDFGEVLLTAKDTASEPNCVALDHVLGDSDFDWLRSLTSKSLVLLETIINSLLHLLVESLVEVLKEGTSSGEYNVLV